MIFHVTDIRIILSDKEGKYHTGDYVSGKVIITVNGQLSVSLIKINLNCIADVHWSELPGFTLEGCNVKQERKYLEYNFELPKEYSERCIEDGTYIIPFEFQLPEEEIPSSFESDFGCITYMIEAFVSSTKSDEKFHTEIYFFVESPIRDDLLLSVWGTTEKELSILNLASGNIIFNATIFKKGHRSGETVEVLCRVENNSTLEVRPRATLYQIQSYLSGNRHKTIETILTEAVIGDIIKEEMIANSELYLEIPEAIPLTVKTPNISVKYYIHVTLDIPHSLDLHLNLPIIITNKFALDHITCD